MGTYFVLELVLSLGGLALTVLASPALLRLGYGRLVVQVMLILSLAALTESIMGIGAKLLEKDLKFKQIRKKVARMKVLGCY